MAKAIFFIVLLMLYLGFLHLMFTSVLPHLFLISVVLIGAVAPFLYARTIYYMFDLKTEVRARPWKWLLVVCGSLLLVLIYLDMALLLAYSVDYFLRLMDAHSFLLWHFVEAVFWSQFPLYYMTGLASTSNEFWSGFLYNPWRPILMAVPKAVLLVPLVIGLRPTERIMDTRQPAFIQYFFKQAFLDIQSVRPQLAQATIDAFKFMAISIYTAAAGVRGIIIWPVVLTAALALLPAFIGAVAALLLLCALHAASLALLLGINMALCLVLLLAERAILYVRSGFAKCPFAGCHKAVHLPVYACPACGTRHDQLVPGRWGIFRRRCSCDKAWLPTLIWFGKHKLEGECPHCHKPLDATLFGGNLHFPIYGGTGTGKTMLMMSITHQLLIGRMPDLHATLMDAKIQRNFDTTWQPEFESGTVREKTRDVLPNAWLLAVTRGKGLSHSVYIYDPAGEALVHERDLRGHTFLKYMDGLMLVIDPLATPSFDKVSKDPSDRPSPVNTLDVVHNIINVLETRAGLSREMPYPKRLAVVITKCDVPEVRTELGLDEESGNFFMRWRQRLEPETDKLRRWFRQHEAPLAQLLEKRFRDIRYFSVSALGHSPSHKTGFAPVNVLAPMIWLMTQRLGFALPLGYKLGLRFVEVAAIVTIAAPLVLGLAGVGYWGVRLYIGLF